MIHCFPCWLVQHVAAICCPDRTASDRCAKRMDEYVSQSIASRWGGRSVCALLRRQHTAIAQRERCASWSLRSLSPLPLQRWMLHPANDDAAHGLAAGCSPAYARSVGVASSHRPIDRGCSWTAGHGRTEASAMDADEPTGGPRQTRRTRPASVFAVPLDRDACVVGFRCRRCSSVVVAAMPSRFDVERRESPAAVTRRLRTRFDVEICRESLRAVQRSAGARLSRCPPYHPPRPRPRSSHSLRLLAVDR